MKILYHVFLIGLINLVALCASKRDTNETKLYRRRLHERRSLLGKKNHMFSCIRKMKYWNGLSCEDFTEKTCQSKNYYWDSTQNKCFFTEQIACTYQNKYWSSEQGCVDYTRDTCLEQNMIWNPYVGSCEYEQTNVQYIDLNDEE